VKGAERYLFLRDDDVADTRPRFLAAFALCAKEGVPVVYAVVPQQIKKRLVTFLRSPAAQKAPFDIVQHGWAHRNFGPRRGRYEFGPCRSFESQKKDMEKGWRALKNKFGGRLVPAFVPPFHGYDRCTLRAAAEGPFEIFAAGPAKPMPCPPDLLYLAAQVSVNTYASDYRCLPIALPRLVEETLAALNRHRLVGVLFHHDTLTPANFRVFASYLRFLNLLFRKRICRPVLFSEILRKRRYFQALAASHAPW